MSGGSAAKLPGNLRGYRLKKVHHGLFARIILWIIIILIILWFVNRQAVFDLFDWLKNLVSGISK